jgi:hypothetical protein
MIQNILLKSTCVFLTEQCKSRMMEHKKRLSIGEIYVIEMSKVARAATDYPFIPVMFFEDHETEGGNYLYKVL